MTFGGNTQPKKFGRGNEQRVDWTCHICQTENRRYLNQCSFCKTRREDSLYYDETIPAGENAGGK